MKNQGSTGAESKVMSKISFSLQYDDETKQTAQVFVEGLIQDQPSKFLLDTGCAQTSLALNEFTQSLPSTGKRGSSGALGQRADFDLVELSQISVGSLSRNNWQVSRAPQGGLDRHLFGMDIMRDYCLEFNFEHNEMLVLPKADSKIKIADQMMAMENDLIPFIPVEIATVTGNAVWDTGASITLVASSFVEQHPHLFTKLGSETGTDSTNTQMETPTYIMSGLKISGREFQPMKVAAIPFSISQDKVENPINIILGYPTLKQANWIFDFPNKKWGIIKTNP